MLKQFSILICSSILFFSCGRNRQDDSKNNYNSSSSYESAPNAIEYKDAKLTIKERESQNPLEFLKISGTYRVALLGGDFKLEGSITNKATEVTYKDVEVKITYYSKTNSVTGSESKIFYEFIQPGKSIDFGFKVFAPDGSSQVGFEITDASI